MTLKKKNKYKFFARKRVITMSKAKHMKKKHSKYTIGQKVIITNEDGGIPIGEATILDNTKISRHNKPTNKVQDSNGRVGYVKVKYIKSTK